MLGVLGLATDLGVAFAQRRSMQNAADAGAYAVARVVAKAVADPGLSARAEAEALGDANGMGSADPVVEECVYVDDAGQPVGDCAAPVPAAATGGRVTVREEHPTFFLRALPGAPAAVTTRATAVAHVRRFVPPGDGPFLVCGVGTALAGGGSLSILLGDPATGWAFNPAAVGRVFSIHAPNPHDFADCGERGALFKGLADTAANAGKTLPPATWFDVKEGDAAGTVSADVAGVQGCRAGGVVVDCVVFLPIVVPKPPGDHPKQLLAVRYGAFYVTQPKSNTHHGEFLGGYIVTAAGQAGWTRDDQGPVVIRLTR
jgi:hypothetical protein